MLLLATQILLALYLLDRKFALKPTQLQIVSDLAQFPPAVREMLLCCRLCFGPELNPMELLFLLAQLLIALKLVKLFLAAQLVYLLARLSCCLFSLDFSYRV